MSCSGGRRRRARRTPSRTERSTTPRRQGRCARLARRERNAMVSRLVSARGRAPPYSRARVYVYRNIWSAEALRATGKSICERTASAGGGVVVATGGDACARLPSAAGSAPPQFIPRHRSYLHCYRRAFIMRVLAAVWVSATVGRGVLSVLNPSRRRRGSAVPCARQIACTYYGGRVVFFCLFRFSFFCIERCKSRVDTTIMNVSLVPYNAAERPRRNVSVRDYRETRKYYKRSFHTITCFRN